MLIGRRTCFSALNCSQGTRSTITQMAHESALLRVSTTSVHNTSHLYLSFTFWASWDLCIIVFVYGLCCGCLVISADPAVEGTFELEVLRRLLRALGIRKTLKFTSTDSREAVAVDSRIGREAAEQRCLCLLLFVGRSAGGACVSVRVVWSTTWHFAELATLLSRQAPSARRNKTPWPKDKHPITC